MNAKSQLWKSALAHQVVPEEPEDRVVDLSTIPTVQDSIATHIKFASLPDQVTDPDELFAPASRGELIKIAEIMERAQEVLQTDIIEEQGRVFFIMKNASSPVRIISIDVTEAFLRFASQ